MRLDLRDIPAKVISMPRSHDRRAHIRGHFAELGIDFDFIDGIEGPRKISNVATAHRNAFRAADSLPFMVFEDDVRFCGDALILDHVPEDADIIYLGKNDDGCLPRHSPFIERFGHRSLANLALASAHDDRWLRLHSMVSAHAILFLTDRARQHCLEAQRKSANRIMPLDVRYAYLMKVLNVYTPRKPVFAEALELQTYPTGKSRRLRITHGALHPASEGEVRNTHKRKEKLTVKAVSAGEGRLEWEVVEL